MATSDATAVAIVTVILRHVDKATMKKIMAELMTVPGDKSFRETIQTLNIIVENTK